MKYAQIKKTSFSSVSRSLLLLSSVLFGSFLLASSVAHASVSISIQSLSPSTSVSVGTPVSFTVAASGFTNPTYTITDSMSGTVSSSDINSSGNFYWTPQANDIGTHTLTINVSDTSGDAGSTSEQITVSQAPTVSIQSLSPSSSVNVGTPVSFSVVASGFNSPTYSLTDSMSGTVSSSDINSSGNFYWTPQSNDAGTHTITVHVSDNSGHTGSATETITVANQQCQISSFYASPTAVSSGGSASLYWNTTGCTSVSVSGTNVSSDLINGFVNTGTLYSTATYTISASGNTGSAPTQSLTISVNGSTTSGSCQITSFYASPSSVASGGSTTLYWNTSGCNSTSLYGTNVSSSQMSGSINTGSLYSSATYTLSGQGSYGTNPSQSITVYLNGESGTTNTGAGSLTIESLTPGATIAVGMPISFTAVASGFTNPTYTASDSFGTGGATTANINSGGYFSWTPTAAEIGTHTIVIWATDAYGHSASATEQILVQSAGLAIQSVNPSNSVSAGTTVSFNVLSAGFTDPTFTINDSFPNTTMTSSDINSSGYFTWTPAASDTGVHTIFVNATDQSGHSASTSTNITVTAGASITFSAVSPSSTIDPGTTVSFSAFASGFTTPSFSAADPFPGTTFPVYAENNTGYFTWTPTATDIGTHTITITGTDTYGHRATGILAITVLGQGVASTATTTVPTGTTSSAPVFDQYLVEGSSGLQVMLVQAILAKLGFYSGSVTGTYDTSTAAAVEAFQSAHGLSSIGVVGPGTRGLLNDYVSTGSIPATAPTTTTVVGDGYIFSSGLAYGSHGKAVTELQKRLTAEGIYSGPLNGNYGPLTEAAVKKYQGDHGIEQLGNVGPGTRASLNGGQ